MKSLENGYQVTSRSYYYLLDWNEANSWRYMADNFGKEELKELTKEEYIQLFKHAVSLETKQFSYSL
jgi:DNA phosphorothioation-dependent restriction protein DptG